MSCQRCLFTGLLIVKAFTTNAAAAEIDVRQSQLFLDDHVIESSSLVERVMHQPIRQHANPLYKPDTPWEGPTMNYLGGVYRDETRGVFRAWYVGVVSGGVPGMPDVNYPICTIESEDGIHWTRPELRQYSHLTGGPNNIVLHLDGGCIAAPNIIHEPDDTTAPWKLFIHQSPKTPCHYYVRMATSQDGLHWEWKTSTEDRVYAKLHDRMTTLVDRTQPDFPYVLFGRPSLGRDYPLLYHNRVLVREVFQTRLSKDGLSIQRNPMEAVRPDLEDPPNTELYHMSAFRYQSLYIGLLMIFRAKEIPSAEVQLTTSRDLKQWQRPSPRSAFIPALLPEGRQHGVWDAAGVQPALSPPILHDGILNFYYYGGPAFHGSRFLRGQFQLGVAQLRPDGFASLRAGWREGMVTTKAFRWPGGELVVNGQELGGNRSRNAWIKTAVLDESGQPIASFSVDTSDPLDGDFPSGVPTWSGEEQNMDALTGKLIRLRFFLRQSELFSFRSTSADQ